LFSIQIQITWSYSRCGAPCPHGSDHDGAVVGMAGVVAAAADGTSVGGALVEATVEEAGATVD
jgi:hypothetical protein